MGKAINKYTFYDSGFHGDEYLTKIVKALMTDCDLFIETGTNVATTTAYVSKRFPQVLCFSCEPDDRAYKEAVKNTKNLPNVNIFNETSQNFINRFEKMNLFRKNAVFWLDAHDNNFEWPLKSEVGFITSKFQNFKILIDDF